MLQTKQVLKRARPRTSQSQSRQSTAYSEWVIISNLWIY